MRYIDEWGNEYKSEEEAGQGLLKILRESDDYYQTLSEQMNIPTNVFEWIVKFHYPEFSKEFKKEIENAEIDWVDSCWLDVEEE